MDILESFKLKRKQQLALGLVLLISLVSVIIFSIMQGAVEIDGGTVIKVILGKITGNERFFGDTESGIIAVIWDIRLPRILCGALVGGGLAVAGLIFQSILQNPLADPYTMGVSTGAAFGASLAILLNVTYGIFFPVSAAALICAGLTLVTVILIANRGGGNIVSNLIVAGIILSSILSAAISFIKMLAGENVSAIVFWIMGSLSACNWGDVGLVFPVILTSALISSYYAKNLNIISLGDKNADALGLNAKLTRIGFLIIGAAITAVCVSICGVIGFIGLIVPHMLRFSLTGDNRALVPLSALLGANLLCIADNLTRVFC
ncbi:MAG: iron ABC transporter permease, partial [Oscillospiraceae bacterium]